MNTADLILIAVIAGIAALAVFLLIRRKRKGSSCCGSCCGCACTCEKKGKKETE